MTSDEYPLPDPADYPAEDGAGVDWQAFRAAAVEWANAAVDRMEATSGQSPTP